MAFTYLVASFYSLFSINDYIIRLPFALFGLATLVFFYFFVNYLTKNKKIAYPATFLLSTSYVFYIHARQSRYY
ncbi:MAG: glycosyltransferase family 39 protein [Nanoarchaeota archaeon]|nr:glycosyltransferase family 39 protein [Nanoarchaeota archaeon]